MIWIEGFGYETMNSEKELPKKKAYCKSCAITNSKYSNSAKPIAYVSFNGRPGLALECNQCHSKYVMYESMYIEPYVGRHTSFGFIPPTYGQGNWKSNMPENVKTKYNEARSKRERETSEHLAARFGYSNEEYAKMKKQRTEKNTIEHKKFLQEEAERRTANNEKELLNEACNRKQLIDAGVIRSIKKPGVCSTHEPIRLFLFKHLPKKAGLPAFFVYQNIIIL